MGWVQKDFETAVFALAAMGKQDHARRNRLPVATGYSVVYDRKREQHQGRWMLKQGDQKLAYFPSYGEAAAESYAVSLKN